MTFWIVLANVNALLAIGWMAAAWRLRGKLKTERNWVAHEREMKERWQVLAENLTCDITVVRSDLRNMAALSDRIEATLRDEIERQHELRDEAVDALAEEYAKGLRITCAALRADRDFWRAQAEDQSPRLVAARGVTLCAPDMTARELRLSIARLHETLHK